MNASRLIAALCFAAPLLAQERPTYPEGAAVPRNLTAAEARWLETHPLTGPGPAAVTNPPVGPVHCVAEYEPMEGILMAWEGSASWNDIQKLMAKEITLYGNALVYMVCDTQAEVTTVQAALSAAGVAMNKVVFVVAPTDTIWMRDYGPRYAYQGNCRVIVDHTYNRPRPLDDVFPTAFAGQKRHAFYQHALVHGGGNYHLSASGDAYATRLIANENPSLSETQIVATWKGYQNCDTTLTNPFPTSVDSTQHIDMWMEIVADRKVMVSQWPLAATSTQALICDQTTTLLQGRGYQVFRLPALTVGGVHYTYTNVVICNGLVLIPSYTNSTAASYNAQALAVWQQAMPGYRITQVPCEAIVSAAGVMHCIVMHVPAALGGATPSAFLASPGKGETLLPNTVRRIEWVSDDDTLVTSVDLQLSLDGGQTWPTTIATGLPALGGFDWTVPDVCSARARIRVLARDAQNNTGSDLGLGEFVILGTGCTAANLAYGSGKPGQNGPPTLGSTTLPKVPSTWTLDLGNAYPNSAAFALYGLGAASVPFDGGTVLVAYAGHVPQLTDAAGHASLTLPVPAIPELYGISLFWQTWIANDPGASGAGWAATAGLQMRCGG